MFDLLIKRVFEMCQVFGIATKLLMFMEEPSSLLWEPVSVKGVPVLSRGLLTLHYGKVDKWGHFYSLFLHEFWPKSCIFFAQSSLNSTKSFALAMYCKSYWHKQIVDPKQLTQFCLVILTFWRLLVKSNQKLENFLKKF